MSSTASRKMSQLNISDCLAWKRQPLPVYLFSYYFKNILNLPQPPVPIAPCWDSQISLLLPRWASKENRAKELNPFLVVSDLFIIGDYETIAVKL